MKGPEKKNSDRRMNKVSIWRMSAKTNSKTKRNHRLPFVNCVKGIKIHITIMLLIFEEFFHCNTQFRSVDIFARLFLSLSYSHRLRTIFRTYQFGQCETICFEYFLFHRIILSSSHNTGTSHFNSLVDSINGSHRRKSPFKNLYCANTQKTDQNFSPVTYAISERKDQLI